jgi:hypothetical protein
VSGGAEDAVKLVSVAGFGGGGKGFDRLSGRVEMFAIIDGDDASRQGEYGNDRDEGNESSAAKSSSGEQKVAKIAKIRTGGFGSVPCPALSVIGNEL